jgi:hypothetical protein
MVVGKVSFILSNQRAGSNQPGLFSLLDGGKTQEEYARIPSGKQLLCPAAETVSWCGLGGG